MERACQRAQNGTLLSEAWLTGAGLAGVAGCAAHGGTAETAGAPPAGGVDAGGAPFGTGAGAPPIRGAYSARSGPIAAPMAFRLSAVGSPRSLSTTIRSTNTTPFRSP